VARKDPTCPDCGSSESVPKKEGELGARLDGSAGVPRRCEGCEEASEMPLVVSPKEAKTLGLHSLGGRPESP
jgi:hypothetical protein